MYSLYSQNTFSNSCKISQGIRREYCLSRVPEKKKQTAFVFRRTIWRKKSKKVHVDIVKTISRSDFGRVEPRRGEIEKKSRLRADHIRLFSERSAHQLTSTGLSSTIFSSSWPDSKSLHLSPVHTVEPKGEPISCGRPFLRTLRYP